MPSNRDDLDTETHRVAVTVHYEAEIEAGRVEQYVGSHYADERVQIIDLDTGESLYDDI